MKSIISVGQKIPKASVLISIGGDENKFKFLDSMKKIDNLGFNIYATEHTSEFLDKNSIKNMLLSKIHEKYNNKLEETKKEPVGNVFDFLADNRLDLVINIPDEYDKKILDDEYTIRRSAVDFAVPLITNRQLAELFVNALDQKGLSDLKIKSWGEY